MKIKFGKYSVEITHPDKIIYPDSDITKSDLADYYEKISEYILPHIRKRAITMHRYPNGIDKKSFYQKDTSDFFPAWIKTVKIKKKKGGSYNAPVCGNKAALVYLANLASITPHVWLSKYDSLNRPDRIIFDLDPPEEDFDIVKAGGKKIKDFFKNEFSLSPFVMTTGSSGIHIVVPIQEKNNFDKVRKAAQDIANLLAEKFPDELTTEVRKDKRKGRLYLDTARNAYGQTAVAPYSLRAREGAPVAAPIEWKELTTLKNGRKYDINNIFRRLSRKEDPWKNMTKQKTSLKNIQEQLNRIQIEN